MPTFPMLAAMALAAAAGLWLWQSFKGQLLQIKLPMFSPVSKRTATRQLL